MTDSAVTPTLSDVEQQRLAELEATIRRGAQTFIAVGTALAEIRDRKLYRTPDKPKRTFEDYVQERWGFTRRWAYQQIEAARVVANVQTSAQNGDLNELPTAGHAVELARLPEHEQPVVAPVIAEMTVHEARNFITERKAERRQLRHIPASRRHEEFIRAAEHLVKVAERWQREMTDALPPPQARKQLTVLNKAENAISAVKDAVEYRAATLHSYGR